jgi:metal-responsive CopG/Arc/MetJ family transcriptional regulator
MCHPSSKVFSLAKDPELKRFGVSIPEDLLEQFDVLVKAKRYVGRSEAIRDAMGRLKASKRGTRPLSVSCISIKLS